MSKADYQAAKGTNSSEKAAAILEALGGASNIETLDACMSRLRVSVHDIDEVDETKIKALGATGMFVSGNNLQAIFGTTSDQLKTRYFYKKYRNISIFVEKKQYNIYERY